MNVLGDHATAHPTLLNDAFKPGTGAAQEPLGLQSLRDHLPPWLGGNNDNRTQSLSRMLRALKTATESYLETPLSAAEVVFPFPFSDSYLDTLRSACSSLSLHMPLSAQPPAGILAARVYDIRGNCKTAIGNEALEINQADDPEQLILTVDYSRAALTALLVAEECGIFEYRRVLHDTNLGADCLSFFRGSDTPGCDNNIHSDLARAIRGVTDLPLEGGNGAGLKPIRELVLLGESADDRLLHDVLNEVLGEQSGTLITHASERRARVIEPLFAASRGLAQDCWDRMNFQHGDGGGCAM